MLFNKVLKKMYFGGVCRFRKEYKIKLTKKIIAFEYKNTKSNQMTLRCNNISENVGEKK